MTDFKRRVLERRAEMATECECLAAWNDDYACICNQTIDFPVNSESVEKAYRLIGQISVLDRRAATIAAIDQEMIRCQVKKVADFLLPKALVLAALQDERIHLIEQLAKTGVVSTDSDKIRSVLER